MPDPFKFAAGSTPSPQSKVVKRRWDRSEVEGSMAMMYFVRLDELAGLLVLVGDASGTDVGRSEGVQWSEGSDHRQEMSRIVAEGRLHFNAMVPKPSAKWSM